MMKDVLAPVMESEEMYTNGVEITPGSSGSDDSPQPSYTISQSQFTDDTDHFTQTPATAYTPSTGLSSGFSSWNSVRRPRGGSGGGLSNSFDDAFTKQEMAPELRAEAVRPPRPNAPARQPSSTYAPQRNLLKEHSPSHP